MTNDSAEMPEGAAGVISLDADSELAQEMQRQRRELRLQQRAEGGATVPPRDGQWLTRLPAQRPTHSYSIPSYPVPDAEPEVAYQRPVRAKRVRPAAGLLTPMRQYCDPLMQAISNLGGSGSVQDVEEELLRVMKPVLTELDYQPSPSAHHSLPRWRLNSRGARAVLHAKGYIVEHRANRSWALTELGEEMVKSGKPAWPSHMR